MKVINTLINLIRSNYKTARAKEQKAPLNSEKFKIKQEINQETVQFH